MPSIREKASEGSDTLDKTVYRVWWQPADPLAELDPA